MFSHKYTMEVHECGCLHPWQGWLTVNDRYYNHIDRFKEEYQEFKAVISQQFYFFEIPYFDVVFLCHLN